MKIIETKNLTKSYGSSRGIVEVNLAIEEGDFFGFIGPNGAGKSTTIRTILGLIFPNSGSAQVFGLDTVTNKIEILKNIGYMPSEADFYGGMKVKDVIRLSADLYKKDCSVEANKLCEILELNQDNKIDELSLGNRKKVSIVCALQHRPSLYILDEPTSGLDPLIKKRFFDILKERNQEGATVFFSSHVLSEIEHYCKHAAIIKDGRIIAFDEVSKMSHTNTKKITIKGLVDLDGLDGVSEIVSTDNCINFLYNGKINKLINFLVNKNITDLMIVEPTLEEVFMQYYQKEVK